MERIYAGRYTRSEHECHDNGHYFTVRSKDKRFALIIETDGKHVVYIRAGRLPEAEYVERCL